MNERDDETKRIDTASFFGHRSHIEYRYISRVNKNKKRNQHRQQNYIELLVYTKCIQIVLYQFHRLKHVNAFAVNVNLCQIILICHWLVIAIEETGI